MEKMIISVNGGHGTLNYNRICRSCGGKGTILCDGGFETCINKDCKSHNKKEEKMGRVEELEYALEVYGEHKEWCHWIHFPTQDCNCGLHAMQKKEKNDGSNNSDNSTR